jgi:molybdate transport system regulatory protein
MWPFRRFAAARRESAALIYTLGPVFAADPGPVPLHAPAALAVPAGNRRSPKGWALRPESPSMPAKRPGRKTTRFRYPRCRITLLDQPLTSVSSQPGAAPLEVARIRLGRRIWLQDGGEPIFGTGICQLLVRVDSTGSLRCAASDMGMAYSKAWQVVHRAEEHFGFALIYKQVGGKRGGGSTLSAEGRRLVASFAALTDEAGPILDRLYEKHFGTGPSLSTGQPAPAGPASPTRA